MGNIKAVLLSIGGSDSTTVLGIVKVEGYCLYSMSFDYGQRHAIELQAATPSGLQRQSEWKNIWSLISI